ncbi:MAG TPA: AvaI/BsoBI family type II restriction endonuclease, partial [Ignavibacteria bacterium]
GLHWNNKNNRTLLYNMNLSLVKKNIDLILVNGDARNEGIKTIRNNDFIALGELKGGIDPAGADEHWKTAHSALNRIRSAFKSLSLTPKTFFVGAAIEKSMASEIFNQLENGELDNACNLNHEEQLFSICNWLINL